MKSPLPSVSNIRYLSFDLEEFKQRCLDETLEYVRPKHVIEEPTVVICSLGEDKVDHILDQIDIPNDWPLIILSRSTGNLTEPFYAYYYAAMNAFSDKMIFINETCHTFQPKTLQSTNDYLEEGWDFVISESSDVKLDQFTLSRNLKSHYLGADREAFLIHATHNIVNIVGESNKDADWCFRRYFFEDCSKMLDQSIAQLAETDRVSDNASNYALGDIYGSLDLVIPIWEDTDEMILKFALRTLDHDINYKGRIITAGKKPMWLKNTVHIPFPEKLNVDCRINFINKMKVLIKNGITWSFAIANIKKVLAGHPNSMCPSSRFIFQKNRTDAISRNYAMLCESDDATFDNIILDASKYETVHN